jgi:hypothetical protein
MFNFNTLEVRKFIAVILVIAYIVLLAFLVAFSAITGKEIKVSVEFVAFSSMVNLIVGAYFGKSTMAEGSKMNKDP